jgi:hypothetical protein
MVEVARNPWTQLRWGQIVFSTLVFGTAVGFAGRATHHMNSDVVFWLGKIGAPWLIAAFLVGAIIGERRSAVIAGAASQALAVAVYYALMYSLEGGASGRYALAMTIGWSFFAAMLGAGMAYVGALTRSKSSQVRAAALAVISGLMIGESLFGFVFWNSEAARTVLTGELVAGIAVLGLFAPRGQMRRAVAFAAAVALAALVVETGVTDLMLQAGWAGGTHG